MGSRPVHASPTLLKTLLGFALLGSTSFTSRPTRLSPSPYHTIGLALTNPVLGIGDDAHTRFPTTSRDNALETPYPIDTIYHEETRILVTRTTDSGSVVRTYFRDCGVPSPNATAILHQAIYYRLDREGIVNDISTSSTGIRPCPEHDTGLRYARDEFRDPRKP